MSQSPRRYRPALERLEVRDVPATTTVLTNLSQNVLTVEGTDYADRITLTYVRASNTVRVQASTAATGTAVDQSFSAASTALFVVAGEGGNDAITIDETIRLGARLFGGHGNDTINGGGGPDVAFGGSGNDSIFGRAGNDILFGDGGSDFLDGGLGTNDLTQDSAPRAYFANAMEQEVVRLVNVERSRVGLAPLALNPLLSNAARLHSADMARWSNLAGPSAGLQHTIYATTLPTLSSRVDYVGYTNASNWGENIAYGYSTAAAVVAGWMSSPGHRANILSTSFRDLGVGTWTDSAGRVFWTQAFGAR